METPAELTGLVEALKAGAWYSVSGYGAWLLIALWSRWKPDIFDSIPAKLQWLPAYLVSGLTAFALAFTGGLPWEQAAGAGVFATLMGGSVAVGTHRTLKERKHGAHRRHLHTPPEGTKPPRSLAGLLVLVTILGCLPATLSGCAAGPLVANNPALASVVQKVLTWLGVVDSVVSTLLRDPNVPPDFETKYQSLRYQLTQAALVVEELVQQGQESHQQTLTALDQLQGIANEIVALVRSNQVASRSANSLDVPEPRFR